MRDVLTLLIIICIAGSTRPQQSQFKEDATLDVVQLANKYGQKTEEYDVITEDGYVLKMYRLVGDAGRPVLLVHGVVDSTDSFLVRGNTSLAVELARDNYDVWSINFRGNMHSRRHLWLNPDRDPAFWEFSMQEIGYYDMPAAMDFVLNATGQEQLQAIGFSEGTTVIYILGATRPEYNDKIKVFISLAPVCYIHNAGLFVSMLFNILPWLSVLLTETGNSEFVGFKSPIKQFINMICNDKQVGYDMCARNGLFLLSGSDPEELEPEFLPVITGHFPTGTSVRNLNHFAQVSESRRFAMYDHGPKKNLEIYGSKVPPEFDLRKVTMRVALFVAKNDPLSTIRDVKLLRKKLPNVVEYKVIKPKLFNHADYIWGKHTHNILHPHIFDILNRYK